MAVKDLGAKIEEAEAQRRSRYPVWDIIDDASQIREMSEKTWEYCAAVYPKDFPADPSAWMWEIVPRIVVEVFKQGFEFLTKKKTTESREVSLEFEGFLTIGIEFAETPDGHKSGTFNPVISVADEMTYDNKTASKNKLVKTPIDMNRVSSDVDFIMKQTQNVLQSKYKITAENWKLIYQLFTSFLRVSRDWLIQHKDDKDYGIEINMGNVIIMAIEKWGEDNDPQYTYQISSNQWIKMEESKDDDTTEKQLNE